MFPLFGVIVHVVYGQEVYVVSVLGYESPGHSLCSAKVCEGSGKGDVNGRFGWEFWIEDGLFDDVEVLDGHREMSEWLSILRFVVVRELALMFFRRRQLHLMIYLGLCYLEVEPLGHDIEEQIMLSQLTCMIIPSPYICASRHCLSIN